MNLLEMLTSHLLLTTEVLVSKNDESSKDTEEETKTKDNKIADGLTKWGLATEEGLLAAVLGEGKGGFEITGHGVLMNREQ